MGAFLLLAALYEMYEVLNGTFHPTGRGAWLAHLPDWLNLLWMGLFATLMGVSCAIYCRILSDGWVARLNASGITVHGFFGWRTLLWDDVEEVFLQRMQGNKALVVKPKKVTGRRRRAIYIMSAESRFSLDRILLLIEECRPSIVRPAALATAIKADEPQPFWAPASPPRSQRTESQADPVTISAKSWTG